MATLSCWCIHICNIVIQIFFFFLFMSSNCCWYLHAGIYKSKLICSGKVKKPFNLMALSFRLHRVFASGQHSWSIWPSPQRWDWLLHAGSQEHVEPPSGASATDWRDWYWHQSGRIHWQGLSLIRLWSLNGYAVAAWWDLIEWYHIKKHCCEWTVLCLMEEIYFCVIDSGVVCITGQAGNWIWRVSLTGCLIRSFEQITWCRMYRLKFSLWLCFSFLYLCVQELKRLYQWPGVCRLPQTCWTSCQWSLSWTRFGRGMVWRSPPPPWCCCRNWRGSMSSSHACDVHWPHSNGLVTLLPSLHALSWHGHMLQR